MESLGCGATLHVHVEEGTLTAWTETETGVCMEPNPVHNMHTPNTVNATSGELNTLTVAGYDDILNTLV